MILLIKISKYLYVHFTTVFLFLICYFNRNIDVLIISYGCVLVHEVAHLISALFIGLNVSHITLYPFGVNLKLKNTIVYSISDEIILYLSGPLMNAVLAIIFIFFTENGKTFNILYWNNIMLFLFNLLPIIPMDGGIILNKIIARKMGYRISEKIMKILSTVLIILLLTLELFLIQMSSFNYTIIFICTFLIGNIFTTKEKYHIDYVREIIYYKKKNNYNIKKAKVIIAKADTKNKDIVKYFTQGYSYIIFKENGSGKITEIATEREIIEELLK